MSTDSKRPDRDLLQRIKISSPCSADWSAMRGDDQARHCEECQLKVIHLSAYRREEAEDLLASQPADQRLCVRMKLRSDGSVITAPDRKATVDASWPWLRRAASWFLLALGASGLSACGLREEENGPRSADRIHTDKDPLDQVDVPPARLMGEVCVDPDLVEMGLMAIPDDPPPVEDAIIEEMGEACLPPSSDEAAESTRELMGKPSIDDATGDAR